MRKYNKDGGVPIQRTTTLYRKVLDEFIPVSEYSEEFASGFPEGAHLIISRPGMTSRKYNIDPDFAPLIAAGRYCEDEIAMAIVKASERKPAQAELTKEQVELWNRLSDSLDEGRFAIEIPSARECAEAGVKALIEEAEKLLQHEAVRNAYDHFMLMCQLVKEKK